MGPAIGIAKMNPAMKPINKTVTKLSIMLNKVFQNVIYSPVNLNKTNIVS